MIAALTLSLAPWLGKSLPTASPAAAKYRLSVHGSPRGVVELRASGLPDGWVASFCTPDVCSPFRYAMHLDARGQGSVEFQAIRTGEHAPHRVRVTIAAGGATRSLVVQSR